MRETFRILPVYTGDVSGVCSALYELGGMVVIHDPSGCNSTYNTHDEIRWYDQESLIFLSGLKERDAILGNDERLIDDTVSAAQCFSPKFIALCSSPIPFLNGTDFRAVCRKIAERTGLPVFYVPTNAMHDYTVGAGQAFVELARHVLWPETGEVNVEKNHERQRTEPKDQVTINLLGLTPLDFASKDAAQKLQDNLLAEGIETLTCWSMGSKAVSLERACQADVNLVVSAVGLPIARYMQDRFGLPYVIGVPTCALAGQIAEMIRLSAIDGSCRSIKQMSEDRAPKHLEKRYLLIGEAVTCLSLAAELEQAEGAVTQVLCTVETGSELLRKNSADRCVWGEEEVQRAIEDFCAKTAQSDVQAAVIADPLYAKVLPDGVKLIRLPHLAFSGRIYLNETADVALGTDGLRKDDGR